MDNYDTIIESAELNGIEKPSDEEIIKSIVNLCKNIAYNLKSQHSAKEIIAHVADMISLMDESGETSKLFNKVATSLSLTKILTKIINSKFSTQEVMSDERNLQSSNDEIADKLNQIKKMM